MNNGDSKNGFDSFFLDKIVTEKNLSNASIGSYKSDLKLFHKFLKIKKFFIL